MVDEGNPGIAAPKSGAAEQENSEEAAAQPLYDVYLYARVSTDDKNQNPENQLLPLRAWAQEGLLRWKEFVDYESAKAESTMKRLDFLKMFRTLGQTRGIAVDKVDRFSRAVDMEGMHYAKLLADKGKYLYVLSDNKRLDGSTSRQDWVNYLGFRLLIGASEVASYGDRVQRAYERKAGEAEREHRRLRWGVPPDTMKRPKLGPDGLPVLKPNGKVLYEYVPVDAERIRQMLKDGSSIPATAQAAGCAVNTVKRIKKLMLNESGIDADDGERGEGAAAGAQDAQV